MITLTLISESDSGDILKILQKKYPGCKWEIEIGPTYDTDHPLVTVRTDMPHEQIKELSINISAIEDEIADKYGEAIWEWFGSCKCGNSARIYSSEAFGEDCYCICSDCSNERFREVHGLDECRMCGKKYDQFKDPSFRTHFEVHVSDESIRRTAEDKITKEQNEKIDSDENYCHDFDKECLEEEKRTRKNSFIYEIGYNIHTTEISKSECCSLECAKRAYIEWFDRVVSHPFTKECLEFKKNERLRNSCKFYRKM